MSLEQNAQTNRLNRAGIRPAVIPTGVTTGYPQIKQRNVVTINGAQYLEGSLSHRRALNK